VLRNGSQISVLAIFVPSLAAARAALTAVSANRSKGWRKVAAPDQWRLAKSSCRLTCKVTDEEPRGPPSRYPHDEISAFVAGQQGGPTDAEYCDTGLIVISFCHYGHGWGRGKISTVEDFFPSKS
jgi:hypothetical protein